MSAQTTPNAATGVLPGPWPDCPDAPLVLRVRGELQLPRKMRKTLGRFDEFPLGLVLELDRIRLCPLRDGVPVHVPTMPDSHIAPFLPLAAVGIVEPGELQLGEQGKTLTVAELGGMRGKMTCSSGPAVWLRTSHDLFLPTDEPQELAREIERRRAHVAKFGGVAANEVWRRAPSLRVEGPDGYEPASPSYFPDAPTSVDGSAWRALPALPASSPPAGRQAPQPPATPDDLPHPEELRDYDVPVHSPGQARLSVTGRRLLLSRDTVVTRRAAIEDHPAPTNALSVPLAELQIVQAGTISGSSPGSAQQWYAPDASTLVDLAGGDGPALWLWGPATEWVVRTPDAQRLAADIRMRQQVSVRYPVSSDLGPERRTWRDFPFTQPVTESDRKFVPPPPDYAPAAPTVLPPGGWQPM